MTRYVCVARLAGTEIVFLWESDETSPDRVVLHDDGFIVTYSSESAARAAHDVADEAPSRYDFDALDAWCSSSDERVDCKPLLDAWNLFGDLPRGDVFAAEDAQATAIYDKLFWGCNLPSMTPSGEHYVPTWTPYEVATLKRPRRQARGDVRVDLSATWSFDTPDGHDEQVSREIVRRWETQFVVRSVPDRHSPRWALTTEIDRCSGRATTRA